MCVRACIMIKGKSKKQPKYESYENENKNKIQAQRDVWKDKATQAYMNINMNNISETFLSYICTRQLN